MKIEIKRWDTGAVIFAHDEEDNDVAKTVAAAAAAKVNLAYANLRWEDLRNSDLRGATFSYSEMSMADIRDAIFNEEQA